MVQDLIYKSGFVLLVLLGGILVSCSEEEVFDIQYQSQLRLFIEEDPDGMELYTQDVYPDSSVSFKLDQSDDLYFYVIDNVNRSYAYNINNVIDTIFGFNGIVDAAVTVNDDYTGEVFRIRDNDTSRAYGLETRLQRYAYFLKLYGNSYQYAGWRFWAYSCLNISPDGYFTSGLNDTIPAYATKESGGVTSIYRRFLGDYVAYKQEIVKLSLGDSITYHSNYQERLFAEEIDGVLSYFNNTELSGGNYITGWTTPQSSDRFYHLITIDSDTLGYSFREVLNEENEVIDSIMVKTGDIVIPFALDI